MTNLDNKKQISQNSHEAEHAEAKLDKTINLILNSFIKGILFAFGTIIFTVLILLVLILFGFNQILSFFSLFTLFESGVAFLFSFFLMAFGSSPHLTNVWGRITKTRQEIIPQEDSFNRGIVYSITGFILLLFSVIPFPI